MVGDEEASVMPSPEHAPIDYKSIWEWQSARVVQLEDQVLELQRIVEAQAMLVDALYRVSADKLASSLPAHNIRKVG